MNGDRYLFLYESGEFKSSPSYSNEEIESVEMGIMEIIDMHECKYYVGGGTWVILDRAGEYDIED